MDALKVLYIVAIQHKSFSLRIVVYSSILHYMFFFWISIFFRSFKIEIFCYLPNFKHLQALLDDNLTGVAASLHHDDDDDDDDNDDEPQ